MSDAEFDDLMFLEEFSEEEFSEEDFSEGQELSQEEFPEGLELSREEFPKDQEVRSRRRGTKPQTGGRRAAHGKKRERLAIALAAIAIVVILVVGFLLIKSLRKDELFGTWSYDSITVYYFDGKGNGELQLPLGNYEFRYQITDGTVSVDFVSEAAKDAQYAYEVQGNVLTLIGSNGQRLEMHKND